MLKDDYRIVKERAEDELEFVYKKEARKMEELRKKLIRLQKESYGETAALNLRLIDITKLKDRLCKDIQNLSYRLKAYKLH